MSLILEKKVRTVWDDQEEGNESVTKCNQLKLQAEDGEMLLTDMAYAY